MTSLLYANIAKALEALNVRPGGRRAACELDSPCAEQVSGQSHPRWQAKCSVLQHVSATATSAKDAYLVSLSGDAHDVGYVVLRRVLCASWLLRTLTRLFTAPELRGRSSKQTRPCLTCGIRFLLCAAVAH